MQYYYVGGQKLEITCIFYEGDRRRRSSILPLAVSYDMQHYVFPTQYEYYIMIQLWYIYTISKPVPCIHTIHTHTHMLYIYISYKQLANSMCGSDVRVFTPRCSGNSIATIHINYEWSEVSLWVFGVAPSFKWATSTKQQQRHDFASVCEHALSHPYPNR